MNKKVKFKATIDCKTVDFILKLVSLGQLKEAQARGSLSPRFQPRSRPFVLLLART